MEDILTMHEVPTFAWHQPIMVDEVLELLRPRPGAIIVDGTVGTGGHSMAIAPRLLPDGALIAIDRDAEALNQARQRLVEFESTVRVVHDNYRNLPETLAQLGYARVDGIVVDLGMSSWQVNDPQRGFSFSHDGPLDMRMDRTQTLSAEALVNDSSSQDLEHIVATLGEERFAARIAQRIVQERRISPITTTAQLASIIARAVPGRARHGRLHVATRTFQALRMAVNDELGALEAWLHILPGLLNPGGRVVVLAFHSLEDRLVKQSMIHGFREGIWHLLTKKPLRAGAEEIARNPRARSAKLRAVERC